MTGFRRYGVPALIIAAGAGASAAHAQVDAGRVVGQITDPTGAVIPGAQIILHSKGTGTDRTVTANDSGEYQIPAVPAGDYTASVTVTGFSKSEQAFTVTVGGSSNVNFKLSTSASSTTIEVQGSSESVQVNTTNAEISQVITPKQVIDLPSLTRNPYDFVSLSGNVSSDPGGSTSGTGGGIGASLSGQRAAGTEILLDGVENEDNYAAAVGQNIPLDSVQEYRVITNGFDAQYGRASGGIVNLISKSGSNQFHGSLYEYNRISALASNTYYEDATGQAPDHFTRNQFGYSVGGRIVKDKLFFFSNTEWNRIRSTGQQTFEIPSASFLAASAPATQAFFNAYGAVDTATRLGALVPVAGFAQAPLQVATKVASIDAGAGVPQNLWTALNRFDYTVNPKISMYFRAGNSSETDFPGTNSLSPYAGFDTGVTIFNQSYLYNLNVQITQNLLSNSKVSFNRLNQNQPLNGAATPTLYLNEANTASVDSATGLNIVFPGYLPTSPGNAIPFGGPGNVYQFQENMTWIKGAHTVTFGGEFFQLRDNRTYGAYEGAVEQVARNGTAYGTALQALQAGNLYSFQVAIDPQGKFPCTANADGSLNQTPGCTITYPATAPNFTRENTFNDGSWYVQDSYKVSPRVNLTYGLRWDYYGVQHNHDPNLESNFYFGNGASLPEQVATGQVLTTPNSPTHGLVAQDFTNYSPRLGAAWDVLGDGKWSVRAGFGMSYERNFGNVTYNVIQNPPNYAGITLTSGAGNQYQIYTPNFGPFAASSGSTAFLPTASLRALDPHMPTAYTENYSFSVQHQLTPTDLISLEYSGAHGVHQYAIAGFNGIGYGSALGSTDPDAYGVNLNRLNHQYGGINQRLANGASNYNGLNVRYETQNFRHYGVSLSVNYTFAHALDNLSSTFSSSSNNFNLGYLNPYQPRLDWGNADYDVRHRVAIGGTYEPNFLEFRSNRIAHTLLGGLEFAPIATARTGTPFTIYDCTNGINACPRVSPAADLQYHGHVGSYNGGNAFNYLNLPVDTVNPFLNSEGYSDFSDNLTGPQFAGVGRNQFYGPNNVTFDMGVYKNFHLGPEDRYTVQLRAEFYNILNHSNDYPVLGSADYAELVTPATATSAAVPGNVNVEHGTPGGGSPSSADERRNTQLAIRFQF